MIKISLVGLIAGLFMLCMGSVASAGLIIASGDATPAFHVGSPDNDQFFENILQGGSNVFVHDLFNSTMGGNLVNFYNGLTGASNTYLGDTTLTASTFLGVDLFVTGLSTDGLDAGELASLDSFVDSGGSVLFMGDYFTPETLINDALSYIGSGMSLYTPILTSGTNYATVAVDLLTAGVSQFEYGANYGVAGGTSLFFDTYDRAFMAYESTSVPEPATMFLFGTGLIGLAGLRRRKKA